MSGGEGAKNLGEIGEKIASKLLDKIGWNPSMYNVSIPCSTSSHLNSSNERLTKHVNHGLFQFRCSFRLLCSPSLSRISISV
jgi:hypothetical protein